MQIKSHRGKEWDKSLPQCLCKELKVSAPLEHPYPALPTMKMKENSVSINAKYFQCESAIVKLPLKPLPVNQTDVKGEVVAQNLIYSPPRKTENPGAPREGYKQPVVNTCENQEERTYTTIT